MGDNERLDDSVKKAQPFVNNPSAFEAVASRADTKARKNRKHLLDVIGYLDVLIRLSKAWAMGRYKDVSISSILIVLGAVIYFVNPFDFVPDFLPLMGLTDDAGVIALAVARVRGELHKFEDWEREITLK